MAHSFTLLNVDTGTWNDTLVIDAAATGLRGAADWSVRMQRLRSGLSEGVDVVWLDNGCTKLAILPTRGMGIWKGSVAGTPLQWNSPVERPVHPSFVDPMRRGGIGWLDGFSELICRCGLGWHGAPGTDVVKDDSGNVVSEQFLPLHGRIANLAAHEVTVHVSDEGEITVTGVIDEASVFGGKLRLTSTLTTHIGSSTFEISDTVSNIGGSAAEVELLYHCNFGRPFLGEGATFHIAAEEVAPRDARAAEDAETWTTYLGPTDGYTEQCYYVKPMADESGRALAVLRDSDRRRSVAVQFETRSLPWLTLWKNTQAEADGYCTGLEPGTGFPNLKTFERQHDRIQILEPGASQTFQLAVFVALDADDTSRLIEEVEAIQGSQPTTVQAAPKADWSPV